ncbi:hypothetical protein HDU76_003731 [Blyttiomyces sp. JEL0837]|nr:hypothetical protein HDU76_003731 [Blyttiomyces sp. JEL0837]
MDRTKFDLKGISMLAFRAHEDAVRWWDTLPDEIFAGVFQLFATECSGLDLSLLRKVLVNSRRIYRHDIHEAIKSHDITTVLTFLRLFKGISPRYNISRFKTLHHRKVFGAIFDCFTEGDDVLAKLVLQYAISENLFSSIFEIRVVASKAILSQHLGIVELFFDLYESLIRSLPQSNMDDVKTSGRTNLPALEDFINDIEDPLVILAKDTKTSNLLISRGAKLVSPLRPDILDNLQVHMERAAARGDVDMVKMLLEIHDRKPALFRARREVVLDRSIAIAAVNGHQDVVELLSSKCENAKFMERTGKLVYCAKRDDLAGVVECVRSSNVVAVTGNEKRWNQTKSRSVGVDFRFGNQAALMAACENRNLKVLKVLLAAGADDSDNSILKATTRLGFDEIVNILLGRRTVSERKELVQYLIFEAASLGRLSTIRLLLGYSDRDLQGKHYMTLEPDRQNLVHILLRVLIKQGNYEHLQNLLSDPSFKIDLKGSTISEDLFSLYVFKAQPTKLAVIRLLLDYGAHPEYRGCGEVFVDAANVRELVDCDGKVIIGREAGIAIIKEFIHHPRRDHHRVATRVKEFGFSDVASRWLETHQHSEKGFLPLLPPTDENNAFLSPIEYATSYGKKRLLQALIRAGEAVENGGMNGLNRLSGSGTGAFSLIDTLVRAGLPCDDAVRTAAGHGNLTLLRRGILAKLEVGSEGNDSKKCLNEVDGVLEIALAHEKSEVVEFLLKCGCKS